MPTSTVQKVRLKQALLLEAVQMLDTSISTLNGISLIDLRQGQAMLLAQVSINLEGVQNRLRNVLAS